MLPAAIAPDDVAPGCTPAIITGAAAVTPPPDVDAIVVVIAVVVVVAVADKLDDNNTEVLAVEVDVDVNVVIFSIRSIPGDNVCAANCHFERDVGVALAVSCCTR